MRVVIAGPDEDGLGAALSGQGVEIVRIDGLATEESLIAAGIDEADVLVLTSMRDASAIPVACDRNPDIRVVTYARDSLPEFARRQADLAVDPELLTVDVVAEELV
jgi:Trk K+ transport system NAD-binding subunit